MKQKHWLVSVFDKTSEIIKDDTFYTTDTEAYLIFEVIDEGFTPDSATVTVYNIYGNATINVNVEVVDGLARYEIPEEAIAHSGGWRAQVVYTKDNEDYTTGVVEFEVSGHLLDNHKPKIVVINNWNSFVKHSEELIDDWEQLEKIRQANERQRELAEKKRHNEFKKNESSRQVNEQARESAESVRVANEEERISKDSERDSKIETLEEQFQNVVDETTDKDVISAPELIAARNGEANLKTRLDKDKLSITTQLQQTEQELSSQLAQNASFHAQRFIGKLENGLPATIVFLGDSTTEQNATTNGQPNHVGLLKNWLESKYGGLVTVVNAGISGNSISQMLGRLQKDVLSKNPDLVVICSGINDAIGTNKISVEKFKSDYSQIIEMIIATSGADIILRTPNRVINPVSNTAIDPFVQVTRALATKYITGLYDVYKRMVDDVASGLISMTVPEFFKDGIHPNENGQGYIFEDFKPFFIQTNTTLKTVENYNLINGLGGFRQMNTAAIQESLTSAIKGKVVTFNTTGRAIETDFIGTDFTLFYVGGPNTGQFIVYVDDVAQPVVDTYSPIYTYGNYATYSVPNGIHKIKIENQPTKNASSSGNRIMIEGIVYKKEPLINDVITPHGFVFLNQSVSISLTASTNNYFLYNGVTDNSDIIDHNLETGEVTVKQTGLYDLLYTNRITADPESNVVVGYTKNGVIQKQAYDFFPSGTGKKSKTVDLVETLELVAGGVIRFFVNVGGTTPTTISNAKISIKK